MKNISRRVFIKGLAVAGVAAAASTVLAGCNTNMIPGVDDGEGEVEVPSTSGVLEYTDKDDNKITVKVSALGMTVGSVAFGGEENAAIKLKIENNLGVDLPILAANPSNAGTSSVLSGATKIKEGEYYILAEAYNDGNKNDAVTVVTTAGLAAYTSATSKKPASPAKDGVPTVGYLQLDDVTAKQNVTLKLTLKKCVEVSSSNGLISAIADQTFTFKV